MTDLLIPVNLNFSLKF